MRHSRDIDDLRADVAANCRTMIALAEREGLRVLVTETVRDGAYQKCLRKRLCGRGGGDAVVPRRTCRIGLRRCKMRQARVRRSGIFARVGEIGK
mgnify:CR=1 FL=1